MDSEALDRAKDDVRTKVWESLERAGVVGFGVRGRIPNFMGADEAADRLATLQAWHEAAVVKSVPDAAQRAVRERALVEGKLLYMAVPKLAEAEPFYLLDPAALTVTPETAADRREAARIAPRVDIENMRAVDLVVTSCVAVSASGARLGKGAGYSDIEAALLASAGLIGPETAIVTTVHDLQVVDDPIPEAEHDFHVDLIVTPTRVIRCTERKRPTNIVWAEMPASKIREIPALAARRPAGPVNG